MKVGDTPIIKFLRLAYYSFRGDISFNELEESEIKRFIEVCNNRINRAGILLKEVAMVLGFVLTALSIIAVLVRGTLENKSGSIDPILPFIVGNLYTIQFRILVIFLFVALILLIILLAHYRTHVHAGTAFKEEAILNENYLPQSPTQTK